MMKRGVAAAARVCERCFLEPVQKNWRSERFRGDLPVGPLILTDETMALRAVEKSPSASSAKEVHSESRPKNQPKPGRWSVMRYVESGSQAFPQEWVLPPRPATCSPSPSHTLFRFVCRELKAHGASQHSPGNIRRKPRTPIPDKVLSISGP